VLATTTVKETEVSLEKGRVIAKMPKFRAIILTANRFEDMELFFPYFRLIEEGIEVDIAGPKKGKIHGESGRYELDIDKSFSEINPDDYGILILPGGAPDGAPTTVRKNKNAQNIAKAFFKLSKPVAAICHGPYTLISADLIKGKHLTGYWYDGVPEEIEAAGGIYEDRDVVVDGNLITSRYPMDLPVFMREVMKAVNRVGTSK
jgi:protease I